MPRGPGWHDDRADGDCTPVGLDGGGAGLGTMWGTERARQMLATAGFGHVAMLDSPRPQNCIFVCRP